MTKGELEEIQEFLEDLGRDTDKYIDDMGVFESILSWLRQKYREQAPSKLGSRFNESL